MSILKKDIQIYETESIKGAFKKLNRTAKKVLLVTDDKDKLLGTITDGDIRRYILSGKSLENNIMETYNRKPIYMRKRGFSMDMAKKIILEKKTELLPILDEEDKVVDFIEWSQLFSEDKIRSLKMCRIDIPVVIMAGGEGARLDPFTKILPKPLIPIGDKPIIEIIIEEFRKYGVSKYYLMLGHKSEMIESYFNGICKDYKLKYVKEKTFLGTAGGIKLLEKEISDFFIVSNCDSIIKADFADVLNFHKEENASLTILSSIQHYKIPYGVIKFKEGGKVGDILEKPEYTFTINAGVYIFKKDALRFISENTFFNMTDLIKNLIKNNKKVFTYPVNEGDYIDIGQWEEYKKAITRMQF